jgi:hypothetical protein
LSLRRVFVWTCDDCRREETRTGYGSMPPGWTYSTRRGGTVEHRCQRCANIPAPLAAAPVAGDPGRCPGLVCGRPDGAPGESAAAPGKEKEGGAA